MLLPYGDRAIVDIRKLRDYCLNPDIPGEVARPAFLGLHWE
jgi:hypothetical protein